MTLRSLFPVLSLSALSLGLFFAAPRTANAAEVMCSNDYGSCTVSNDGSSHISCTCVDNSGDESSGGDEFAGLSEEELNVICLEHLAFCEPNGDGDGDPNTSGTSTGDPTGDGGTSTSDSGDGSTTDPNTTGDTADSGTTGDTAGSTSEGGTDGGSTGDPMTSTGGDSSTSTGGDTGTATAGDSGSGSGSDGGSSAGESGDGGSETGTGGDSAGGGDEGGKGCAVNPHASGIGLLLLSMLGLLGLRRREEA